MRGETFVVTSLWLWVAVFLGGALAFLTAEFVGVLVTPLVAVALFVLASRHGHLGGVRIAFTAGWEAFVAITAIRNLVGTVDASFQIDPAIWLFLVVLAVFGLIPYGGSVLFQWARRRQSRGSREG
jgi:hypothetical protein